MDAESVLVVCSFVFTIILYTIIMVRGPRPGIMNKGVYFDKTRLPSYFKFLVIVVLLSLVFGYTVTLQVQLAFGFAGLNILLAAIMGLNLFLFRKSSKTEK